MPNPKTKTPIPIPTTVPAGIIAGFTGLTAQRVAEMGREGKIPTTGKGKFSFRAGILAIVEELRGRGAARPGQAAETRRKEAEATTAEIDAGERTGLLMLKADAKLLWAEAAIETRLIIEGAEFLKPGERAKLLDRLEKIEFPDKVTT